MYSPSIGSDLMFLGRFLWFGQNNLIQARHNRGRLRLCFSAEVNSVKDKGMRTMLFTHMGNKCFRTRYVSFGKGFKDRIGLLPEPMTKEASPWKRVKTI